MQIKTTVKYYFTHPLLSFSRQVMSNSLWPHGLQHTRLLCPSPSGVCPSWWPLNRWCHPTVSSPVALSSFCLRSLPASGAFSVSQLFASDDQNTGVSASVSPSSEYSGLISFKINWFDLLAVQGTLKCLLQHHSSKASILRCSAFFMTRLLHPYVTPGKTTALPRWTFVGKVMSLLFINTLSGSVVAFLPRSNRLLTCCLQSPSAVILELKNRKFVAASTFSPSICH